MRSRETAGRSEQAGSWLSFSAVMILRIWHYERATIDKVAWAKFTKGMDLHVRLAGRSDLARQIYRQIRAAIVGGRLARGDRLPPTRELARRLDVARNTAALAYEWLASEGLLAGRRGGGTFVESDPVLRDRRTTQGSPIRHRAVWDAIAAPGLPAPAPPYDFGVGMPDPSLFPFEPWRRLLAREVRASKLT